ncbi:MAG: hypothetical protein WAJ85_09400, partial [Candidatus Baltobacteraceae bacterium]
LSDTAAEPLGGDSRLSAILVPRLTEPQRNLLRIGRDAGVLEGREDRIRAQALVSLKALTVGTNPFSIAGNSLFESFEFLFLLIAEREERFPNPRHGP